MLCWIGYGDGWSEGSAAGAGRRKLDLDELGLFHLDGTKDGHVGKRTFHHGDLVARVEAWAGLAILVNLVGHGIAFGNAEAEVLEEGRQACKEAGGGHAVVVRLGQKSSQDGGAGALAAGVRVKDDGANFSQVRAVKVERAAAEELRLGMGVGGELGGSWEAFGDGEVTDVLAELGVAAAQKGSIAGEGIDEVEDVAGVLKTCFVDPNLQAHLSRR